MKEIQRIFCLLLVWMMFIFTLEVRSEPKKKKSEFDHKLIRMHASPDFNYRFLSNYYNLPETRKLIQEQNQSDQPKVGWTCGISLIRNFNQRFGLSYGVSYSNKGYSEKYNFSPGSEGTLVKFITRYRYHYLDFPFTLLYHLGKEKNHFFFQFGISPSLHLAYGYVEKKEFTDGSELKSKELYFFDYADFPPIVLSTLVGFGYNYSFSEKLNFQIEPVYKYALNVNSFDLDGVGVHLWNLGCELSCVYVLK